jgi:hypothetical protein
MRSPWLRLVTGGALLLGAVQSQSQPDLYPDVPWEALHNARDLAGWKLAPGNGAARFECREGAIVGTTVQGEPITFLQTEKMFGNFVLEWEFLIPDAVNSGVQFRSHGFPEYRGGAFHGYQFEMVGWQPSQEARWTGGIFDELRRGWIGPVVNRSASENPYQWGDWNTARVLAVGDRIQTWVNGVPVAELHDALTPAGYIALQLYDGNHRSGDEVRWRNFRIKDLDRVAGSSPGGPFVGVWKGATSQVSLGLYARIDKCGADYVATMFEDPDLRQPSLATLSGRTEGQVLVLTGGDWSGRIEKGVFRGRGRTRGFRIVGQSVERTAEITPMTFALMPGAFALARSPGR